MHQVNQLALFNLLVSLVVLKMVETALSLSYEATHSPRSQCGKLTVMIILHFHLQLQLKYKIWTAH